MDPWRTLGPETGEDPNLSAASKASDRGSFLDTAGLNRAPA